jgi:hypothetical protein
MTIVVIDYPTFLTNVQTADLSMLTSFIVGVPVRALADAALADTLFAQAQRLYNAGLLVSLDRQYTVDGTGAVNQSFIGQLVPQAAGYVAQLARERVTLSRAVLP